MSKVKKVKLQPRRAKQGERLTVVGSDSFFRKGVSFVLFSNRGQEVFLELDDRVRVYGINPLLARRLNIPKINTVRVIAVLGKRVVRISFGGRSEAVDLINKFSFPGFCTKIIVSKLHH